MDKFINTIEDEFQQNQIKFGKINVDEILINNDELIIKVNAFNLYNHFEIYLYNFQEKIYVKLKYNYSDSIIRINLNYNLINQIENLNSLWNFCVFSIFKNSV